MRRSKTKVSEEEPLMHSSNLSPELRENQMIALSMDIAEKQLREGTASSQVITHFLKLGTEKERLERERLRKENAVLEAKAEAYKASENMQQMYAEAIAAMKTYGGNMSGDKDEEDDEEDL